MYILGRKWPIPPPPQHTFSFALRQPRRADHRLKSSEIVPFVYHVLTTTIAAAAAANEQLLSERGEGAANGKLCNVVEVTADSPFRLQLPMKVSVLLLKTRGDCCVAFNDGSGEWIVPRLV